MTENFDLVIFDWDGTLFNSVGQIVKSLQFAAQHYHLPLKDEDAKRVIGLGLPEVMQILFPQVPHLQTDIMQIYSQHYTAHVVHDHWFDGVSDMLHELKAQGRKLAVATGKSRRGLDRVLNQTNSNTIFDITRAASETLSKPNPLMLQQILEYTQIEVHRAVMIGDTSYDLQMAQNIAMPCIGVSYGVHDAQILSQFNPLKIVDNVYELHKTLI